MPELSAGGKHHINELLNCMSKGRYVQFINISEKPKYYKYILLYTNDDGMLVKFKCDRLNDPKLLGIKLLKDTDQFCFVKTYGYGVLTDITYKFDKYIQKEYNRENFHITDYKCLQVIN